MTDAAKIEETEGSTKKPKIKLGVNYWRLWVASVISNLGDGVAQIAYPWLASAVTRNPITSIDTMIFLRSTRSVITPAGEVVGRYRKMFPFRPQVVTNHLDPRINVHQ